MSSTYFIDKKTLLKLDFPELENLCQTDDRFSVICQDLEFWNEYYYKHKLSPPSSWIDLIQRDFEAQWRTKAEDLIEEIKQKLNELLEESEEEEITKDTIAIIVVGKENISKIYTIKYQNIPYDKLVISADHVSEESEDLVFNMEFLFQGGTRYNAFPDYSDILKVFTLIFKHDIDFIIE